MSHADYDKLLQIVHASAAFELLRAGLALGLFEILEEPEERRSTLLDQLQVPPARLQVLIEGLAGLGLVERSGTGAPANCASLSQIVRRGELDVLRALVAFQAEIVSVGQRAFAESLTSDRNSGLDHFPGEGDTLYARLESDERLRTVFFDYMQTYTEYASGALFAAHDFSLYRRILDVGGGGGALATRLARACPNTEITVLDIDFARETFDRFTGGAGDIRPIAFHHADMHAADFPAGFDLVLFAHQLVIWSPEQNSALLRKAYDALVPGGTVLICSSILDDDRRGPLMGLLDAVYFQAVASGVGRIYSFSDYLGWLAEAGFSDPSARRLDTWTPHGIVTARKPTAG